MNGRQALNNEHTNSRAADAALLIVRLALGAIFFAHGAQKLLGWFGGHGPEGFVGEMAKMGIPAVFAWLAIIAEFFGGLGLIAGVLARLSALGIIATMVVAVVKVHFANGFLNSPAGAGFEYNTLIIAAALLIVIVGPGRFSLLPDVEGRLIQARK